MEQECIGTPRSVIAEAALPLVPPRQLVVDITLGGIPLRACVNLQAAVLPRQPAAALECIGTRGFAVVNHREQYNRPQTDVRRDNFGTANIALRKVR